MAITDIAVLSGYSLDREFAPTYNPAPFGVRGYSLLAEFRFLRERLVVFWEQAELV